MAIRGALAQSEPSESAAAILDNIARDAGRGDVQENRPFTVAPGERAEPFFVHSGPRRAFRFQRARARPWRMRGSAESGHAKVSDVIYGADRTRKVMPVRHALSCNRRAGSYSGASLGGVCRRLTRVVPLGGRIEPDATHAAIRPHSAQCSASS